MTKSMTPLAITASGMVTAVGFNSPASCAAIHAGISGAKEANLWDYETGNYISAAKVPLPHWWEGLGKLAELVVPAIHECLVAAKPIPAEEIPIFLCVAAPDRPFRFEGLDEQLLEEIEYRLKLRHHPSSLVIQRGRIGGVVALQEALRIIKKRIALCCIIAGVDSFLQQKVFDAYMEQRRILTPNNSNGFIPGEAGSSVLVAPRRDASEGELEILGIGIARESATIESEEPLRGDGLAQAIKAAFSQTDLTMFDIACRITDLNGEHYKFKEATFAVTRFIKKPKEELFDLWHPIEYIGEVGAAIAPCVLGVALHAGRKGYAPGETVLCHFSNDNGERAALIARFSMGNRG